MYAGLPYGERYRAAIAADDGLVYVVRIEMQSWTGPVARLERPSAGVLALTIEGGQAAGQAADPLAEVAASVCSLTIQDDLLRLPALAGYPDGVVRLRLYSGATEAAATDLEWAGYLIPATVQDTPLGALPVATLQFMDGLGFLKQRPHAGDGTPFVSTLGGILVGQYDEARMVQQIARHLGALGAGSGASDAAWDGVTTCSDWRPYIGTAAAEVDAGTDPLFAVKTYADAWLTADGATDSAFEAIRQIVGRMGCQLYQSGGRWRVDQRGALARAYGGSGITGSTAGTVPTWAYAADGSGAITVPGSTPTRTDEDRLVDAHATGAVEAVPTRAFPDPVRSFGSPYAFRPELADLVVNGGVERAGSGGAAAADQWTLEASAERRDMTEFDAEYTDRYALGLPGIEAGASRNAAEQSDLVYFIAPEGGTLRFSFAAYGGRDPNYKDTDARYWLDVGTYGLRSGTVEVSVDALRGSSVPVRIKPFLTGTVGADGDAVDGTELLPPGTVLRFPNAGGTSDTATLTLTRPLAVGDVVATGDLDAALSDGDQASACYFGPAGSATNWIDVGLPDGASEAVPHDCRTYARSCDGDRLRGYVGVRFECPVDDTAGFTPGTGGDPAAQPSGLVVGDVALEPEAAGRTPDTLVRHAGLPPGFAGVAAALPARSGEAWKLGDGPHPETLSRLRVEGDDGTTYDTQRGPDTGWTEGAYPDDGSAVSTGRSIDGLAALDALRQTVGPGSGGPTERWSGEVVLSSACKVRAHNVVRVWQRSSLAHPAAAGQADAVMYAAPRPGETVTLDPGGPNAETLTVDSVTRGLGSYVVTFTTNLATSHPAGTRAHYTLAVWRDGWRWDVARGRFGIDGTALAASPTTDVLETITYR